MKPAKFSQRLMLATALSAAFGYPALADTPPQREKIHSADQLPRRTLKLDMLPSKYLNASREQLAPLVDALETNLRADLNRYDITDKATLRGYYGRLLDVAEFREDWAQADVLHKQIGELKEKPAERAMHDVLNDLLRAYRQSGNHQALQRLAEKRFGQLDWSIAGSELKKLKGSLEMLNPALIQGGFEQQIDVLAKNAQMNVDEDIVSTILAVWVQARDLVPVKDDLLHGLQVVVDKNASQMAKVDIWQPRQFSIPADAKASTAAIGIWDSGVDTALFQTTQVKGIAFDEQFRPSTNLLKPLGEVEPRWPQMRRWLKGKLDMIAALDTAEAREMRAHIAQLKPEQARAFSEDSALTSLHMHGTHVAGIAADGNPFARIFSASMLMNHRMEPLKPSRELAQRTAQAYTQIVQAFKDQGVRVVNMSWRYGPNKYESALAWHTIGKNAEERKRISREWFEIERDALRQAIASAPEILFVAGAGNENNSADFQEYIPAGLRLPNLLAVGAVDRAGDVTAFSSQGKTVEVYANGFEVESILPGGEKMRLSGTSMASPQVANLAAKLFALKPALSVAEARRVIIEGAEPVHAIPVVNPRKSAALLGIRLDSH